MEPFLSWSEEAKNPFSQLSCLHRSIRDVKVGRQTRATDMFKETIIMKMRQTHSSELLKDDSTVRAYRNLYWSLGIDPRKPDPQEKPYSDACYTVNVFQSNQ
jgi:DNA/RNA-binding domain of Phe-tRNA-synthetase-like protein